MKQTIFTLNPLNDVFPNTVLEDCRTYSLHMAKNEGEGFIIGINTDTELKNLRAKIVCETTTIEIRAFHIGFVPFSRNTIHIGTNSIRALAPGVLPEYFSDEKEITLKAGTSCGIYISAYTSSNTPTGVTNGKIILTADGFEAEIDFDITVYNVTLPAPENSKFTYVCWARLLNEQIVKNVFGLELYSEEYWEYVKNCAKILRRERQNMINIELDIILARDISADKNGNLIFDYKLFDKFAEIMLNKNYMGTKYLVGMHLLQADSKFDPLSHGWAQRPLNAWIFEQQPDGTIQKVLKPANSPDVEKFHRTLFSSLAVHLREKGWSEIWCQHVADEVNNDIHYQQTKAIYDIIHEYLPEARTIDAVRKESAYAFGKSLDIHVPLLWQYDMSSEAYDYVKGDDTEIWQYTCLQPEFDYLSRLGDYPLISTRLLCWYNFKHNLTGYLHYAWATYRCCTVPWNPYADVCCYGPFPCDSFIVYPDKENRTVLESVRSEAMRDSIEDYELLSIVAKKHPKMIKQLVDTVVTTADDYIRNTQFLMQLRVELLKLASEEE